MLVVDLDLSIDGGDDLVGGESIGAWERVGLGIGYDLEATWLYEKGVFVEYDSFFLTNDLNRTNAVVHQLVEVVDGLVVVDQRNVAVNDVKAVGKNADL